MKEWHERRARYRSLELESKVSASNLCMVARRRRVQRRETAYSADGHDLTSLLDHIFNGNGEDSDEEGDLEEELQHLYEIACQS